MNSIFAINPYRWKGLWVFDDPSVELEKEPFVEGADTLLDILTDYDNECVLLFSTVDVPGFEHTIKKVEDNVSSGTTYNYKTDSIDHDLWLCPALLKYYENPPEKIHFKVKRLNRRSIDNDE